MSIPTALYRGYELRAYSHQVFPPYSNPFAKGPRRFSSIVRIVTIPSSGKDARLYSTVFGAASPASAGDALELAMQFGKDIVDGKVQAAVL
ncbi:hypothetical protein [Paraburkholderia lacunae]|uniref:Uncharacterized protein n=1 Tax=Paraburkholderia lacunae TaxID=2211104 RepID=A0A370N6C7_9BURK|nr:hypothetical protein [Paraburkholderia lacunae]RDK01038.1 hypothetical protein DLM46_19710 [Paraburkholderia lacunae]